MSALLAFDATLQRALLDLVVATLWADGDVADREIAAARGAQIALGLVHPSDDAASAIGHGPSDAWRTLAGASDRERLLAYAAAVWTALADRVIDPGEARFLREVRHALALDDGAVRFADTLARWIDADARDASLPAHRSFAQLLVQGARRVAQVEARRAAA
ncbi:hypothetical protein [Sandaracinus amylolyticus]|uniref:hypothetical protein n=1 Tax=Sandaracinus amylolyticus TaxID=927083 RepID=UPI0012ECC32A|nr:hypothetical protein [Sandaracinus amylolyticus]